MQVKLPRTALKSASTKTRNRLGFTLVELLVVIGIIALLISILIPVLGKARQSAIQIQCMSTLKQFSNADQFYVNQSGYHMPGWWAQPGGVQAYNAYERNWGGLTEFRKALGLPVLFPMAVGYLDPNPTPPENKRGYRCYVPRKWYCANSEAGLAFAPNPGPDPDTREVYYPIHYSYGMNVMGVDIPSALPPGMSSGPVVSLEPGSFPDVWDPRATQADPRISPVNKIFHGFRPSQVKRPAEKIHFADALYYVINVYGCSPNTNTTLYPGWHNQKSNYDQIGDLPNTNPPFNSQRSIAWRHNKGANVVFFDNHGEWMPKDKLYNRDASGNIVRNDNIWKVMN